MDGNVIEARGLLKLYGTARAVDAIDLDIRRGEIFGLLGPNGAGKTTLFNLITGDLKADAGSIKLFGTEMIQMSVHQRTHLSLARTYQIITLFNKDSLLHNVVLSLMGLSPSRWNVFTHLGRYGHFEEEAMRVLTLVGLDRAAHRPVSEVAYGDKRMLEIAMAMAQKPKLLLLDEPLAGLSKEERVRVSGLVASIPRETTVVMIEHDMDTALDLAERLLVLHYGKVIVDGERDEVIHDQRTKEVYLGS